MTYDYTLSHNSYFEYIKFLISDYQQNLECAFMRHAAYHFHEMYICIYIYIYIFRDNNSVQHYTPTKRMYPIIMVNSIMWGSLFIRIWSRKSALSIVHFQVNPANTREWKPNGPTNKCAILRRISTNQYDNMSANDNLMLFLPVLSFGKRPFWCLTHCIIIQEVN